MIFGIHGIAPCNFSYSELNRNKRSIALNLKTDEGPKIFDKLAEMIDEKTGRGQFVDVSIFA